MTDTLAPLTEDNATGIMHELHRDEGDVRIMWRKDVPDEVAVARDTFDQCTKDKGMLAYKATGERGIKGEQIREFDPDAERIIFVKQNVGG